MKLLLVLTLLVQISYCSLGQSKADLLQISTLNNAYVEQMQSISSPITLDRKSLYLDKEWSHVMIMTKDNQVFHSTGRINLVRMYVEILVDRHTRKLNENKVKALIINGSRIIRVPAKNIEDRSTTSYMSILSTGKMTLLEGYKIGFKVEEHAYSGVVRDETAFVSSDFYATSEFNTFTRISGKKDILSLMQDKKTEVETFIKINKLKLQQGGNLSILFNYYNSLQESSP